MQYLYPTLCTYFLCHSLYSKCNTLLSHVPYVIHHILYFLHFYLMFHIFQTIFYIFHILSITLFTFLKSLLSLNHYFLSVESLTSFDSNLLKEKTIHLISFNIFISQNIISHKNETFIIYIFESLSSF